MDQKKYPSLSAVLATRIVADFGDDRGKPATYISPVGQYGIVPYSELAMHAKIADQPIVQYALFGEPGQPAKYAHVKLADGRWNHGLPGEVLSWEARNLHGGEKTMIPEDKYPSLSQVLAKGYAEYSNEELVEMINKEATKNDSKKLEKLREEMAYRKITPVPTVMTGKPVLKPWDGTRYTGMPKNKAKTTTPGSVESKKKVLTAKHPGERVVFQTPNENYRILEIPDADVSMEDLKGDVFNPKHIGEMHQQGMTPEKLAQEEKEFEKLVDEQGVYGYALEKWNPQPGKGYETVDSVWGFVGPYDPKNEMFNHYIVEELKGQIPKEEINSSVSKKKILAAEVYTTNEQALESFVKGFKKTGPKHGHEGTEIRFERANDMSQDGSVNLHAESYFVFLDDPEKAIHMLQEEGHEPKPGVYDEEDKSASFDIESDDGFLDVSIHPEKNMALIDGWVSAFTEDDQDDIEKSGEELGRLMSMWGENLKKASKA